MAHWLGRMWKGAALLTGSGAAIAIFTVTNYKKSKLACSDKAITPWDNNWDRRAPTPDATDSTDGERPKKPSAKRHLILIRHGQYDLSQPQDKLRVLTELGHQQAAATGKRLNELQTAKKKRFNVIVHSTMTRAIQTTEDVIKGLDIVPEVNSCDMLREGAPCRPEPSSSSWKPENHHFYQEGIRIEAAFRKYFHRASVDQKEDTIDVIICHANVIRYFVCRALQLPPEAWLRLSLAHCSITHITIRPSGRVQLRGLGDAGHLPVDMVTYT